MAISLHKLLKETPISRAEWLARQRESKSVKAPRRMPMRSATIYAIRNKRMAIRDAAENLFLIIITYQKIGTNEIKKYVVEPYSFRYMRTRQGLRKVFYGYDMKERTIKSFVLRNIRNTAVTTKKFRPKWPVEIARQ